MTSSERELPAVVTGVLSKRLTRREFIMAALAGGAGATFAVLIPMAFSRDGVEKAAGILLAAYPRQRIASLSELKPGEPIDFEYPWPGQQNLLFRLGAPANGGIGPDGDIVAFSALCTHMGCPLRGMYKDEHKILGPCPCHYTTFDLRNHGMVVLGQATQNLPQVTLALEGDDIYATGVMGLIYGSSHNLARARATKEAS